MSIIHVKDQAGFDKEVLQAKNPVLVDFYADWCPPCKALGKVFEQLISESNGWNIVKLNCDDAGVKSLAQSHGVSGIPAVFFYNQGKLDSAHSFTGFDQGKLQKAIDHASSLAK
ncbi:hypothetical protein ABPG74_012530 [Tetrahymena malaccensis]